MANIVDNLFSALGGVMLFVVIDYLLKPHIDTYKLAFIVVGILVIVMSGKIREKFNLSRKAHIIAFGSTLLFIGFKPYIFTLLDGYWWIVGIVGLLLIFFSDEFTNFIN